MSDELEAYRKFGDASIPMISWDALPMISWDALPMISWDALPMISWDAPPKSVQRESTLKT